MEFGHKIIDKMGDESYPQLNLDFIMSLSNESKRGAVLIGTAKVEEYLDKMILHSLPRDSKKYQSKLLEYPGILSSLASKIELLYGFRLLDERFYKSLMTLKSLRNDAAHTSEDFSLEKITPLVKQISDFELHFDDIVHELAQDNLLKFKKHKMIQAAKETGSLDEWKIDIVNKKHATLKDDPDFKNELVIWKLSYSLTLMCIKLSVLIDEYACLDERKLTWLEILNRKNLA